MQPEKAACSQHESRHGERQLGLKVKLRGRTEGDILGMREDYFRLFGLEPAVCLDSADLERTYKQLQRRFHPDLVASRGEEERRQSAARSTLVNQAYQTLQDPMRRVQYLLRLKGITALEEEGTTKPPMELLVEVMQTREQISCCESREDLAAIKADSEGDIADCLHQLSEALQLDDMGRLEAVAVRLRYATKILEEARRKDAQLEDSGPSL